MAQRRGFAGRDIGTGSPASGLRPGDADRRAADLHSACRRCRTCTRLAPRGGSEAGRGGGPPAAQVSVGRPANQHGGRNHRSAGGGGERKGNRADEENVLQKEVSRPINDSEPPAQLRDSGGPDFHIAPETGRSGKSRGEAGTLVAPRSVPVDTGRPVSSDTPA